MCTGSVQVVGLEAPQLGHDPDSVGEGHLRSRGPSGPPRSGESGKMAPLLSRRPVTYRCALLSKGRPVVTSDAARSIPQALRRFVAWRDRGCTIDACQSRYRLQPHHIRELRHGGVHDPDNLTTLGWYHHHVAIHGQGFRIAPDSPRQRRRLIRSRAGPDPPWRQADSS